MSQVLQYLVFVFLILGTIMFQAGCVHEAIVGMEVDPDPLDTTLIPVDTMIVDTIVTDTMQIDTSTIEIPCDTTKVNFRTEILPILNSNCALSGCHNSTSAADDIILTSYQQVIASDVVVPYNLSESDLYEAITEDEADEIMPPTGRLSNDLIVLIAEWILQGADSLSCDISSPQPCGVDVVSYQNDVTSIMASNCNGCHASNVASGGVITDNHNDLKSIAESGRLYGALAWLPGFKNMPQNLPQLDSCSITNIKIWIDEGAQNN